MATHKNPKMFITDPISRRKILIWDLNNAIEKSENLLGMKKDDRWSSIFEDVLEQLYRIRDGAEFSGEDNMGDSTST